MGYAPAVVLGLFGLFLLAHKKPAREKTTTEIEIETAGLDLRDPLAQKLLQLETAFHSLPDGSPELLSELNAVRVQLGLKPLIVLE